MKARIAVYFLFMMCILLSHNVLADQPNTISERVLGERFGNFSTAGSFVLIKIQDASSQENSVIVCENEDWFVALATIPEYADYTDKQYTDLMLKKYDQTFIVNTELFKKLSVSHAAPLIEEYDKAKAKGLKYIVDTYLKKGYWDTAKNKGVYIIKSSKSGDARSLLRMLLEMGFVVRRDCESGERFISSEEIDSRLN